MIHIVAFSGGKDSTALVLWAKEHLPSFRTIFCDTGHESALTYAYIEEINHKLLGGKLQVLRSEKYHDMYKLLLKKKSMPKAQGGRFCTYELKIEPMLAYFKTLDDDITLYQGIRADESLERGKLTEQEYNTDWDCYVVRPLLRKTAEYCFDLIRQAGIMENPLYRLGFKRVGCFPCVFIGLGELRRATITVPEIWDRIHKLEFLSGRHFFRDTAIPLRFCTGFDVTYNRRYPTTDDVRKYLLEGTAEERERYEGTNADGSYCMSIYNLCE